MIDSSSQAMIAADGLSKYYGSFVAIENITFSIPKGQIVAFLGPNGAGKTTTMKILSGFLGASKGSAFISGMEVAKDRLKIANSLGYLPENGPLYADMTPLELLHFFGSARGIKSDLLQKRISEVVEICALAQVTEKPIGKLSRGYRQRVCLGQALLHEPEVLIMDEPTAGLDPNQIRDFRANIKKLGETKTILISTHILQEVEAVADRVLFVHNGRLVFDGTPSELRKDSSLEKAFYKLTDFGHSASNISGGADAVE